MTACRIVNELHLAAGRNHLYAVQGRTSTNDWAQRARTLFAEDAALTERWNALLDGKWRHLMAQTHLGYTTWQQPIRNVMPAVSEIQPSARGELALAVEGDPAARPGDYPVPAVAKLPALSPFGPAARWFDVFNRGRAPVRFTIETSAPWLRVSPATGEVGPDVRVEVTVDWAAVPAGLQEGRIAVRDAAGGTRLRIVVPVDNRPVAGAGFVEVDGHIAIEAPHFHRAVDGAGVAWKVLADFGRTLGGVTTFPVTAPVSVPGGPAPRLEYDLQFRSSGTFAFELHCAPSLDFQPGEPLRLAVSLSDGPPQVVELGTAANERVWDVAVGDGIRRVAVRLPVPRAGAHVLKVWRVSPAVVLQRIVIDTGGLRPSYLGPVESGRASAPQP